MVKEGNLPASTVIVTVTELGILRPGGLKVALLQCFEVFWSDGGHLIKNALLLRVRNLNNLLIQNALKIFGTVGPF